MLPLYPAADVFVIGVAARHPFGGPIFAVRHGGENQFHAARNSDLVEDAQQIFVDGVFAETEFTGDSAVGQAVGDERDNLFLARRQQRSSLGVNDPQGGHLGERVEYVVHLLIVDPDFSTGNALDALAEHRERSFSKQKNAFRARAQGTYHQFAVIVLRQQDGGDFWI